MLPDRMGYCPLHLAVLQNQFQLCVVLVEAGANVNQIQEEDNGQSALHYVAQQGNADICNYLLSNQYQ